MPPSDVWRQAANIAARQDGVASRSQLLDAGLSGQHIRTALEGDRLVIIFRGVYALGHGALSDRGRIRAALLAAGPHAVASHGTAAWLWKLIPTLPAVLDVTLTQGDRRSRPGLRIHHGPADRRHRHGLPLTGPLRTLQDLGFPAKATREALAGGLVRPEDLPASGPEPTRSELERRMLTLIAAAGLPAPVVNRRDGSDIPDFHWPEHRLIVEVDGWATHGRRAAFEEDRARDAARAAAGVVTVRFTWRRITEQPLLVAAQLAAVLAQSPSAPRIAETDGGRPGPARPGRTGGSS